MGAAVLEIFKTLGDAGVDDTALLRGVFAASSAKLRAVDDGFWRENDLAARKDGLDEIAV